MSPRLLLLCLLALAVLPARADSPRIDEAEAQTLLARWVAGNRYYPVRSDCLQTRSTTLKNMGYATELWSKGCDAPEKLLGRWRVDGNTGELYVMNDAGKYAPPKPTGKNAGAVLREQRVVKVNGVAEVWRLQWQSAPVSRCPPTDEDFLTCPCSGFAFGESGKLDLIRARPGQAEERLALNPLFEGDAILPRWPVRPKDAALLNSQEPARFEQQVKNRPPVGVMELGDYDRNGQATEFPLQIGAEPCGHRPAILVGLDSRSDRLHAFGTVKEPAEPLVLSSPSHWKKVLEAKGEETALVQIGCGDHGSEQESELRLKTTAKGIEASHRLYDCSGQDFNRGKLLSKETR